MANRLANATSPYLRQHADNPVDWQVWGEEALAQANREDKPILLSIGYSACHWCHVMAHESFEDPAIAKVMNEHFVNIKVDREERPDLDQIYQTAHALMTRRSGGWPLTMFLTPDGAPFFAGTYFPKESRYGVPGFVDVLPKVAAAYRQQGSAITEHGNRLAEALSSLDPEPASTLPDGVSKRALAGLVRQFDRTDGGFGSAPKFPHAAELDLCLRAYALHGDEDAGTIVRTTLSKMADGGIHDQLGGGFCRYSVDAQWSIPHFEKMLYDNAALLSLYADAARTTNERRFADVARDIVGWVDREMRASDGAFYSSLDADSEGEEGKFYVWTREEARAAVSDEEWQAAAAHYGFEGPPNFEGHAWNPRIVATVDVIADRLQTSLPDVQTRLIGARAGLFRARETRVRPARDDKILTSWNALMIAALARASRALDEPRWADIAFDALDALVNTAWGDDRLHATRHGDVVALNGYLDDHAFLLAALIEAMQTRFRAKDWTLAITLADQLLDRFEDRERGGFFFTSHDHERLFHRMKPAHDNATPSGNGVAAQSLITLSHMTSEQRYLDAAERAVKVFAEGLAEAPGAQSSLAIALERLQSPPSLLVLMGEASKVSEFQRTLERRYRPDLVVLPLPGDDVPDALRKGERPPTGVAAWLCHGTQCLPPVSDVEAVEGLLRANA